MVLRMAGLASRVYQRPVPSRFCCTTVSFGARGLLILRTQKAREERDQSYYCEFLHGNPLRIGSSSGLSISSLKDLDKDRSLNR